MPEFLVESFKSYLSVDERRILDKALGNDFDPSDEDLLELLSTFKWYKSPNKTNIFTSKSNSQNTKQANKT